MAEPTNPLNEFRPFNEETLEDALVPIRERFGEGACELARKHLRNPLRKQCNDLGTVGYRKGKPVCFQVACIRRLYWKQQEIFGIVGGLTCRTFKGCPPSVTFETIERAEAPRLGSVMGFGNSCCVETATMDEGKGSNMGPATCARFRWCAIRPLECLAYFIRRKLFKAAVPNWKPFSTLNSKDFACTIDGIEIKRLNKIDSSFFDNFMGAYLRTNEGLVCSRSAEEVEWIFGDRLSGGEIVILGAFDKATPVGYVVLKGGKTAKRWLLEDWIALRNDRHYLSLLLHASIKFLKSHTPAMMLETTGFSTYADSILRAHLPHVRPVGNNQFSWGSGDLSLAQRLHESIDTPQSWFFGIYDGDLCM